MEIIIALLLLLALVIHIIAVYDVIRNRKKFRERKTQALWLMVVVFLPVLGPVAYLLLRTRFQTAG